MQNPTQKLKRYISDHHPSLALSTVRSLAGEGAVEVTGEILLKGNLYSFNLGFPRSAPENGRPLCTAVYRNKTLLWSYKRDVQPYVGLTYKTRVHLYEVSMGDDNLFLLVVVSEGEPDRIISIIRVDGTNLSDAYEGLLKAHVGRLWGMRFDLTEEEKAELEKLMPQKKSIKK